ncbi:dehydrodolichyl diphosphate synthase complex subunit DHDDS [Odontomachus brunneus]|uniref:dehydrodolichyl diphosphate synthase complex subunit DHDDS n=1 Tax=Odontomachus brunneus TaxID=486640 RepID=UPI0013F2057D|nr:dehydrodolichyl diphosphate synthase complex subunit DHDDS [Odontomachus brunneus]
MSWIKERTLHWFQFFCLKIIRTGYVPRHVAFIMDGNRRYATKKNVAKVEGHKHGFRKLTETLNWCMDLGVNEVTMYAFSIENFKRSKEEVDGLMQLAKQKFEALLEDKDKFMEYGICVRVIGNLSLLAEDLRRAIAQVMVMTKDNNKVFLNIAFAYKSRDEITYAIKDVVKGVKHNEILSEDISEDLISECMYTYNSPNPDLLIRTSGETRVSDFLMWQISDTCVYFSNVLWPEFSVWHFLSAIFYYQRCYPDLQRFAEMQNSGPVGHNNRVSTYVDKLHHEREVMLENMCLPAVQS